jgi:hypothetical protein
MSSRISSCARLRQYFHVVRNLNCMILKSKFKFWILLSITLFMVVTVLIAFLLALIFTRDELPRVAILVFLILFTSTWLWMLFGEFRTKAIHVLITSGDISVSRYFGLGKSKAYDFSKFEGFYTSMLSSKYGTYEYLFLIQKNKRKVSISQFYHKNYDDLKAVLEDHLQNMGQRRLSFVEHLYDIAN